MASNIAKNKCPFAHMFILEIQFLITMFFTNKGCSQNILIIKFTRWKIQSIGKGQTSTSSTHRWIDVFFEHLQDTMFVFPMHEIWGFPGIISAKWRGYTPKFYGCTWYKYLVLPVARYLQWPFLFHSFPFNQSNEQINAGSGPTCGSSSLLLLQVSEAWREENSATSLWKMVLELSQRETCLSNISNISKIILFRTH